MGTIQIQPSSHLIRALWLGTQPVLAHWLVPHTQSLFFRRGFFLYCSALYFLAFSINSSDHNRTFIPPSD